LGKDLQLRQEKRHRAKYNSKRNQAKTISSEKQSTGTEREEKRPPEGTSFFLPEKEGGGSYWTAETRKEGSPGWKVKE